MASNRNATKAASSKAATAAPVDAGTTPNAPGDDQAANAADTTTGGGQQDQAAAGGEQSVAAVETPAPASSDAEDQETLRPLGTALYEVLTPFKFRGVIVKPPEWIELSADAAKPYQAAGVLGTEPGEVPADDDESGKSEG